MDMVCIRHVCMGVSDRCVDVRVAVGAPGHRGMRVMRIVVMVVMPIVVPVRVLMRQFFVHVVMPVRLSQMHDDAEHHQ